MPLSHVRFEDESAHQAESRYLERLQQRQRQVLSTVLHAVDQGPLRSKMDLTNYINRSVGNSSFHRPVGSLDHSNFSAPPPVWGNERKCPACGSCLEERCPAEGRAAPDLRVLRSLQAACEAEVLLGPCHPHGLGSPFPGLHTEWIRETHITDTVAAHPEKGDSALDSTNSSDSWTDSKDVRTSQSSKAGDQAQVSSPQQRQHDSNPQGGPRRSRKAETELPCGLQAWPHLPGVDDVVVGGEVKETRGHIPQKTLFLKEDAVPKPALEPSRARSQGQLGPWLGSHPEDCWTPCRPACVVSFSKKPGSSGPGQPDQVTESHDPLETACTSSLQQSGEEPAALLPALKPTLPLSLEVPTPPSARKSLCPPPPPPRKSAWTGHHRLEHQVEPLSPTRAAVLVPPQTPVKHPLLGLSNNSSVSTGLQEPFGASVHKSRVGKDQGCQEPGVPLESGGDGKESCHFMFSPGQVCDFHFFSILITLW